jgi:hypothetical protein
MLLTGTQFRDKRDGNQRRTRVMRALRPTVEDDGSRDMVTPAGQLSRWNQKHEGSVGRTTRGRIILRISPAPAFDVSPPYDALKPLGGICEICAHTRHGHAVCILFEKAVAAQRSV